MQDINRDGWHEPNGAPPDWNTRPERRRTYPPDAPRSEWEDEYVDLGGEGG
jgi:hypothetical protein